jgi:hypothetical protein
MSYLIWTYLLYTIAAVAMTTLLARTLFHNGAVFLSAVFDENPSMGKAINQLLVTGFYMLNLGYALLIFRTNGADSAVGATENLVTKLGLLLVSLGVMHFVNMIVFWKIKTSGDRDKYIPAVPTTFVPPPPAQAWS